MWVKVRLDKFDLRGLNPLVVDIPLQKFIDTWAKHKNKLTQILITPDDDCEKLKIDESRCKVFNALMKHEGFIRPLEFQLNPNAVSATMDVAKGEFKLDPMTILSNISDKKSNSTMQVTVGDRTLYVSGPLKPDKDADLEQYVFSAFWWVEKVFVESQANMKLCSVKVDDVTFPVLQNIRAIKKHERLTVFKSKDVKTALDGAEVVKPPAAKKARTSK